MVGRANGDADTVVGHHSTMLDVMRRCVVVCLHYGRLNYRTCEPGLRRDRWSVWQHLELATRIAQDVGEYSAIARPLLLVPQSCPYRICQEGRNGAAKLPEIFIDRNQILSRDKPPEQVAVVDVQELYDD